MVGHSLPLRHQRRLHCRCAVAGAGVTRIAMYIPHHMAELYACQGWRIVSLGRYHGTFSMLAMLDDWQ